MLLYKKCNSSAHQLHWFPAEVGVLTDRDQAGSCRYSRSKGDCGDFLTPQESLVICSYTVPALNTGERLHFRQFKWRAFA